MALPSAGMAEKKPKRIISAGGPRNQVVTRPQPHSRLNRYKLRSTLWAPGVGVLRLEIKGQ